MCIRKAAHRDRPDARVHEIGEPAVVDGGVKVGIVVDADCMGEEAGNAFLKTLEEPPAQTVILLLTADPQRLLPTILSRCLRISFGSIAAGVTSPHGKIMAAVDKISATAEERISHSTGCCRN